MRDLRFFTSFSMGVVATLVLGAIFAAIPLWGYPDVTMRTVEEPYVFEMETITRQPVATMSESQRTLFRDEEIFVGWHTFGYIEVDLDYHGMYYPEIRGTFETLETKVKTPYGWEKVRHGVPFAVLNEHDFGVFKRFSSFHALASPDYADLCLNGCFGEYNFSFEPSSNHLFFVFDNARGVCDREGVVSAIIYWMEKEVEYEEISEKTTETVMVERDEIEVREVRLSLFDILF